MKKFTSFAELERVIRKDVNKKIDGTLKNEVATEAKEIVQKHVEEDVYDVGYPKYYHRRFYSGGMIDNVNLVESVKDGELEIVNVAKMNPSKGEKWLNEGYTLSHLIIDGWDEPTDWYDRPRPYMERANDELENNSDIQKAIDKGLSRQGLKKVR